LGAEPWRQGAGGATYLPWDSWQHPYILDQPRCGFTRCCGPTEHRTVRRR
jgi:hypothetical protein